MVLVPLSTGLRGRRRGRRRTRAKPLKRTRGKRRGRAHLRGKQKIYKTKNGQPYIILASGRAKFIKR